MSHQNRVTPFGEIVAVPERGTIMGNRGVLHDGTKTIRRTWQLKRWVLCVTEFKNRKRTIMSPGRYTELFFLDEATGLAVRLRIRLGDLGKRGGLVGVAGPDSLAGETGMTILSAAPVYNRAASSPARSLRR